MLALAGIGRPRAMRRTPSAAVRNAMTHSRVATRKSSGRLTRYTIQKLPVIWFPNDWTATSPSNSRYRERSEQRLVRPVVAGRQDEVPRFAGQMRHEVSAFVYPAAADLDDLVPRQDLKVEVRGQRGQDVDEVLRREGPGFHIRRTIVPRDREIFLFEGRAWDLVEETLHHRSHADLPSLLERQRGPPLPVPAVADPGAVFRDERQRELPEPWLQIPSRPAAHGHDVIRRIGHESLQNPHDAAVRERGLPLNR